MVFSICFFQLPVFTTGMVGETLLKLYFHKINAVKNHSDLKDLNISAFGVIYQYFPTIRFLTPDDAAM